MKKPCDSSASVNEKTAHNQILGAVVMGIGLAMFEETVYDSRNGKPVSKTSLPTLFPPTPIFRS